MMTDQQKQEKVAELLKRFNKVFQAETTDAKLDNAIMKLNSILDAIQKLANAKRTQDEDIRRGLNAAQETIKSLKETIGKDAQVIRNAMRHHSVVEMSDEKHRVIASTQKNKRSMKDIDELIDVGKAEDAAVATINLKQADRKTALSALNKLTEFLKQLEQHAEKGVVVKKAQYAEFSDAAQNLSVYLGELKRLIEAEDDDAIHELHQTLVKART